VKLILPFFLLLLVFRAPAQNGAFLNTDSRNFILNPKTILLLLTAETAGKYYKENNEC